VVRVRGKIDRGLVMQQGWLVKTVKMTEFKAYGSVTNVRGGEMWRGDGVYLFAKFLETLLNNV
jgi:hypothetical protein